MKKTLLFSQAAFAILSALSFADETTTGFPDAEVREYLARRGIPLFESKPGAPLQRDFEARWLKWCRRVIIDPFAARLKTDEETRRRAVHAVEQGMLQQRDSELRDVSFTSAEVAAVCEAIEKAGVEDPLLLWVHCMALHDSTRDFPASEELWKRATKLKTFKQMPAALRLIMLEKYGRLVDNARQSFRRKPAMGDILAAALESLQEKSWRPDEDDILYEHLWPVVRDEALKSNEPKVKSLSEHPSLTEWAKLMLQARFWERKAWVARGHGFASEVTEAGWKGFQEHRAAGVELFRRAWVLRPDAPEASAYLLGITMTCTDTGEPASVWLKRTLDARFDNLPGFRFVMNGMLPRWGGSHEQMIEFGLACAITKRFDTQVPYFFFEVLRDVARDTDDWRPFCRDPLIAKVAISLCRQRVKDAATPELKRDALALLGAHGWLCGEYRIAAETLAQCPEKFSHAVRKQLMPFDGWNEDIIRGESIMFAAGYEDQWRAAERAMEERDLDKATDCYEKIQSHVKGEGHALAATRLAAARTERDLADGGWAALRVDPTLAGWQIQKGEWSGTADGHLINRGHGTSAFIFHTARIGADFQMRGQFQSGKSGIGLLLNHTGSDVPQEKWITCSLKDGKAGILDGYYAGSVQRRRVAQAPPVSSFLVTCHDARLTIEVNGQEVFTEITPMKFYRPHDKLAINKDGRVGFCDKLFHEGNVITVLKCEVRRLPPDFVAQRPAALEDAGRITGPEELLAYLHGTLWTLESKDGAAAGEVAWRPACRDFWFRGEGDDTRHLLIRPGDAKTLDVDGGKHSVRFTDEFRAFEITDWPKKGESKFGKLKMRSATPGGAGVFDFVATAWKRSDSTITFQSDGVWQFKETKKTTTGEWEIMADRTAAVFREDLIVENFEVSDDGRWLIRGDGKDWRRADQ